MYKDIAVCVNEAAGRENVITSAALFAKEMNAQLQGLYVRVNDVPHTPPYMFVADQITQAAQEREDQRANQAKHEFLEITKREGCAASWLEVSEFNHPLRYLLYCDLIITNQVAYEPRRGHSNFGFINNLILETGKPVVLILERWNEREFGRNILIGWDESKPAVRAVADAIPLLKHADMVEVVSVDFEDSETVDVSHISDYLSRRNVSNSFRLDTTDEHNSTAEKVLLNRASKTSADLLVVGGYGHSRWRELVLGGSTRYLAHNSDIPVLFSH